MAVKVLIVDDSKAMCSFLSEILSSDPELDVVGFALDPYEARSMIKTLNPDVLTLDVEMPRMDGLTFLKNLMRLHPMPVVMLSSLTAAGAEVTLEALGAGAVDFLVKRHPGSGADYQQYVADIVGKVKSASRADLTVRSNKGKPRSNDPLYLEWAQRFRSLSTLGDNVRHVLAVGASTGGPEAIRMVLESMYVDNISLILSQHMPARFMGPFAQRLNGFSKFNVVEATDGVLLSPGYCYVSPGDRHLEVKGRKGNLHLKLSDAPPCSGHRPSVDVMFSSLAATAGDSAVGLLLTGMGQDGANGMLQLHRSGAFTVAQDEKSSAVWGMPGTAVGLNAVDATLPLQDIGPTLEALFANTR